MRFRVLVPLAGTVCLLALLVSLSIASVGTAKPAKQNTQAKPASAAAIVPPAVPNAPAIRNPLLIAITGGYCPRTPYALTRGDPASLAPFARLARPARSRRDWGPIVY